MNSIFANLFIALVAHIQQQVPAIRYIDQDLGQLDYYQIRPSISWPAVLIDLEEAPSSNLMQGHQWVDINISFRLAFSPFSSSSSITPDISREAALQFYEIEHNLHQALHGFTAAHLVQPLHRTATVTEKREDPYRVRAIRYSCATIDGSASTQAQHTTTLLKLT